MVLEFPDDQEKLLGYNAMAMGLGLTFGPVIGSFLYGGLGYVNTFYFFTAFIFATGAVCVLLLPKRINEKE